MTIVGIDLGTTYSLVAVMQGGRPVVLPNRLGEHLTPSAVGLADDGSILVGAPARARATTHPSVTVLGFKRDMGTTRSFPLGKRSFTSTELSALVLASLKSDAEATLGEPIEEAVITVPAYFGDAQRQATRDAGALAGLRADRIINEPTAAALAYGLHERRRSFSAAVLDLGGGTFDVTIIEIADGVIEVQSTAGDARLGGCDFDEALREHLRSRIEKELGLDARRDARSWARLLEAAETLKKRLTPASEARIALLGLDDGRVSRDVELLVNREEAERAWGPCLARLEAPSQRALRDAGRAPSSVEEVLLVGGSTRAPCIAAFAARVFGRLPLRSLPPDEAVALGAAVQAALKEGNAALDDLVVTDVAPFTLGIATASQVGVDLFRGTFAPILERGTVIPASRSRRFFPIHPGQKQLRVEVFQGEHSLCQDNTKLGEYMVPLPPDEHAHVDVRFTYDLNGLLEVDSTPSGGGPSTTLVIEKTPGRMTEQQLADARKAMARLKLHPREALPNTTALARAEALYVEVVAASREVLGEAMNRLRTALESRDAATIDKARAALNDLVGRMTRR